MSNESSAGPSMPVLPIMLLAALAAGSFYLYEKPFESTRPAGEALDTSFASESDSLRARLWEDPFTAVAEHLAASGAPNPPSEDAEMGQAADAALALAALQALKASEPASANHTGGDNSNKEHDTLEDQLLATIEQEFDSADKEPASDHPLTSLADQISKTLRYHEVTVLPVMVQQGWYEEDVEQRRRRRYAVLSALGAVGYQPRDSTRVSYFLLPESEEYCKHLCRFRRPDNAGRSIDNYPPGNLPA